MGFGNFLKKAINPLTPFKAIGGAAKNLARGNVVGALKGAATMGLAPGGGTKMMDPSVASGLGLERMPGANVQGGFAAMRSMDPAAKDRMRAALTAGRNDGSIKGPMGMLKFATSYRDTSPPAAGPTAPPPPGMAAAGMAPPPGMAQMGMAPPQGAEQMGMAQQGGPPPQPFLESVQQAIAPPEFSDPYEAQKQRRIRGY